MYIVYIYTLYIIKLQIAAAFGMKSTAVFTIVLALVLLTLIEESHQQSDG